MGLFDKLFKSKTEQNTISKKDEAESIVFDEDYKQLKELYHRLQIDDHSSTVTEKALEEAIKDCDLFIEAAESIDKTKASKLMFKEATQSEYSSGIRKHEIFGDLFDHRDNHLDPLIQSARRSKHDYSHELSFVQKRDSLPRKEITITDTVLNRGKMLYFPEIKYSSVTKSFNKDALTSFVVIDTETTGLRASSERIVQLSAIRYIEWEPEEIWTTYIYPKREMPEEASAINGITDDMLVGKPIIGNVSESFLEFVGDSAIVGYNLVFDIRFLYAEGIDLTKTKRKLYDVMTLAKKIYKNDDDVSFDLSSIAHRYDIYFPPHDSVNDCLATGDLFGLLVQRITY